MKTLLSLLLLTASIAVYAKDTVLQIRGITGPALTNVEKRLSEYSQSNPLSELNPEELRNQTNKALQPFGYFKAEITVKNNSNKSIQINIHPGPIMRIATIKVQLFGEGAQNPYLQKVLKNNPLQSGAPLDTKQYNLFKRSLNNTAEQLGYLHGTFKKAEILVDETNNTAQITLLFDTGHQYYFSQVQFDPTYIRPELLHRFVPFKPGQVYSMEQLLKFNNDLASSGYFNNVLVKPNISDSQTVPIQVHLQPAPKYTYSLGLGYGTDTGVRGRAGMHIIPVNNKGHKFNALAQGSLTQSALQAQYVIPGSNPVTDQYSLTGNFSNLNYGAGYSNSMLVSLAQQHNLERFQRTLSLNSLYESFHYEAQPNSDQFVVYPKGTVSFTSAKSKLFSPSGYNLTFNALGSSQAVLSKLNFVQSSVDAKGALMIEPLRLRLYGHALQGYTQTPNINELPLSLALLLGGTDNLKGYGFNSIGPGKTISYGGFELQKETFKNWYLLGFYDAGSVYNPSPKDVQYDVGAGLMWVSPIGPIKIGFAQPITSNFQRLEHSGPRLIIRMGPDL
ncbi:MAG: hypothetical protein EPN84_01080 [Legionella sp.]|nr:MAG: hypothetical protein EPN84_01080 [Legionella sp.]